MLEEQGSSKSKPQHQAMANLCPPNCLSGRARTIKPRSAIPPMAPANKPITTRPAAAEDMRIRAFLASSIAGLYPMGYDWYHHDGGYCCGGGNHYVSRDLVNEMMYGPPRGRLYWNVRMRAEMDKKRSPWERIERAVIRSVFFFLPST